MPGSILKGSHSLGNKNFFICFDGTWANKNYQSLTRYSPLTAKNSIVVQLYEESPLKEEDKLYFAGPGTDENGIGVINWIAGLSGDMGKYSVNENVKHAYDRLSEKLRSLKVGEKFNLQIIGWSRGGVAVDRFLSLLAKELPEDLKDKIDIIVCNKIDPVPGGVFDRGDKITQLANLGEIDNFTKKIFSFTYYSDTGALNLTSLLIDNFSALYDPNHQSTKYAFPANHEQIAGIKDENGSSDIVKAHIKATGLRYGIQTYELNKESFQKLHFPKSIQQRGFLNSELKDFRYYHRIIGGPALRPSMLSDIKQPEACVDDINSMKSHNLNHSYSQEQPRDEFFLEHEESNTATNLDINIISLDSQSLSKQKQSAPKAIISSDFDGCYNNRRSDPKLIKVTNGNINFDYKDTSCKLEKTNSPDKEKSQIPIKNKASFPDSYKSVYTGTTQAGSEVGEVENIRNLLKDYCNKGSGWSAFFHGHWNRNHVQSVQEFLSRTENVKDIDKYIKELKEFREGLESKQSFNKNGSIATRMNFIFYENSNRQHQAASQR